MVETGLSGYRKLAVAVIALAYEDAGNELSYTHARRRKMERDENRQDALSFLQGGATLTHWCALAGVNEDVLKRAVEERR